MKIYNTRTRRKEDFVPLDPKGEKVGIYYCGPTVYDSLHLGHGRASVVPDMMRRYLEYKGYQVRYVTNFTDVDDNIIKRALRERCSWREITSQYMDEYGRVTSALGNRPADAHPRATDHIAEMVELAESLVTSGNAYVASDGDVYFDVTSCQKYGSLSGRKLEDGLSGASGRLDDEQMAVKHHPGDFIVWKLNRNDSQEFKAAGDAVPGWDSPWGVGRPGWHLECSALSKIYLGVPFDIHGGGTDLMFPHHENENAQCRCAFADLLDGEEPVRYWVHNGFITVKARTDEERASEYADGDAVKMSKSLGNVNWLREMFWPEGPYDPLAVRMLLLSSHYRSPISFSAELLDQASQRLEKIYSALEGLDLAVGEAVCAKTKNQSVSAAVEAALAGFEKSMDDDFNTSGGMASIFELTNFAQKVLLGEAKETADKAAAAEDCYEVRLGLKSMLMALGFPSIRQAAPAVGESVEQPLLQLLGRLRQRARSDKMFEISDQIRDELDQLGFEVQDRPDNKFEIARK